MIPAYVSFSITTSWLISLLRIWSSASVASASALITFWMAAHDICCGKCFKLVGLFQHAAQVAISNNAQHFIGRICYHRSAEAFLSSPQSLPFGWPKANGGFSFCAERSATRKYSLFPACLPGWYFCKITAVKPASSIRQTASASPITICAVVLVVGARLLGQASCCTVVLRMISLCCARTSAYCPPCQLKGCRNFLPVMPALLFQDCRRFCWWSSHSHRVDHPKSPCMASAACNKAGVPVLLQVATIFAQWWRFSNAADHQPAFWGDPVFQRPLQNHRWWMPPLTRQPRLPAGQWCVKPLVWWILVHFDRKPT